MKKLLRKVAKFHRWIVEQKEAAALSEVKWIQIIRKAAV